MGGLLEASFAKQNERTLVAICRRYFASYDRGFYQEENACADCDKSGSAMALDYRDTLFFEPVHVALESFQSGFQSGWT